MSDAYLLLLTAILIFLIVAVLGFVGCFFKPGFVGPPAFVIAATPGDGEVLISWPLDINADKFEVKRGLAPGVHDPLRDVFSGAAFRDDTATNGTEYFYVVVKWTGMSQFLSNEVAATPNGPVPPPPVLTAFVTGKMLANPISVTGWFGLAFTVGSRALTVRTLGRAYAPGNNQTHRLRLIEAGTSTLVGGADVQMTAGAAGEFQYAPLMSPVTLAANTLYHLVSEEAAGTEQFYNHTTTIQTTIVAVVTGSVTGNGTTHSVDLAGNGVYGPLDFQYDGP